MTGFLSKRLPKVFRDILEMGREVFQAEDL